MSSSIRSDDDDTSNTSGPAIVSRPDPARSGLPPDSASLGFLTPCTCDPLNVRNISMSQSVPSVFGSLGVSPPLLRDLAKAGLIEPTPIQTQAIPAALQGLDVLGCMPSSTIPKITACIRSFINISWRSGTIRRPRNTIWKRTNSCINGRMGPSGDVSHSLGMGNPTPSALRLLRKRFRAKRSG